MGIRSVAELSACQGSAGPCCGKATTGEQRQGSLSCFIVCCPANLSPLCPCSRQPPGPLGPTPYKMACTLSLKSPRGWKAQAGAGDCTVTSDLGKKRETGGYGRGRRIQRYRVLPLPQGLSRVQPTYLPALAPRVNDYPVPSVIIGVDPWAFQKYQQAPTPSPSFLGMRDRVGGEGRINITHLRSAKWNPTLPLLGSFMSQRRGGVRGTDRP